MWVWVCVGARNRGKTEMEREIDLLDPYFRLHLGISKGLPVNINPSLPCSYVLTRRNKRVKMEVISLCLEINS